MRFKLPELAHFFGFEKKKKHNCQVVIFHRKEFIFNCRKYLLHFVVLVLHSLIADEFLIKSLLLQLIIVVNIAADSQWNFF